MLDRKDLEGSWLYLTSNSICFLFLEEKIIHITLVWAKLKPTPPPKKKNKGVRFDDEHFDQGFGFIVAPNFPSDAGLQVKMEKQAFIVQGSLNYPFWGDQT